MRRIWTRRERDGLPPTEHTEAVRFMRSVKLHEPFVPALRWLHHIPNGGKRHRTVAAKLRAEGVKSGVHDYFLPVARQGFHGLYIELKTTDGGRREKEQVEFADFVRAEGFRAEFCEGWEQAWAVVCDYLGITSRIGYSAPQSPTLRE